MTKGKILVLGSNTTRIEVQGGGTGPTANLINGLSWTPRQAVKLPAGTPRLRWIWHPKLVRADSMMSLQMSDGG
jgi:hypothetical protein